METHYKFIGLFSNSHLSYEVDRDSSGEGQPSLSELAVAAVDRLAQAEKGFFLMVEGGRIDHAHHETNAKRALIENVEFEKAVRVRLQLEL